MDCASFMNSIYYQAFGEELAADLTWHMIDYVTPRIMYYKFSHNESEKKLDEIVSVSFLAKVDSSQEVKMIGPKVTVNNLEIYVSEILVGNPIDNTMLEKITEAVKAKINDKTSAIEVASSVYGEYGIEVEDDERKNIQNCFSLHDSTKGDVLSRKIINIKKDCGVYSLYGGYGVVTPEIKTNYKVRCVKIQRRDLMAGDIILCSDDPYGNDTYSAFYTGDELTGCFQASSKPKTIRDSEIIDSLFGRFCFVVLRPYM